MTFAIHCNWADYCAYKDGTLEANSYDELFEKMKKFFEEACGFTSVEAFEISNPDVDEDDEDYVLYDWDWDNLRRNQDLADVWNKVKKEIKKTLGKDYFNENQK